MSVEKIVKLLTEAAVDTKKLAAEFDVRRRKLMLSVHDSLGSDGWTSHYQKLGAYLKKKGINTDQNASEQDEEALEPYSSAFQSAEDAWHEVSGALYSVTEALERGDDWLEVSSEFATYDSKVKWLKKRIDDDFIPRTTAQKLLDGLRKFDDGAQKLYDWLHGEMK